MELTQFKKIIQFALDKEKEAVDFYSQCSQLVKRSGMKKAFLEMADEEKKHIRMLEHFQPDRLDKVKLQKVPNLKIGDYLVDNTFSPDMGYQDLLILAMKREEKSYKLYTVLVEEGEDSSIRRLFEILAQEELKHKNCLEREYDDAIFMEN